MLPERSYTQLDSKKQVTVTTITTIRPGREGGNGPSEGKVMKRGGMVNFGVLSSKMNVIGPTGGHQPRFDE